jgi:hypothetical protein
LCSRWRYPALPYNRLDEPRGLGGIVVLPDYDEHPPSLGKQMFRLKVTLAVSIQLGRPPSLVLFWTCRMLGALMPEAAPNFDGDSGRREHDVEVAPDRSNRSPM